MPTISPYGFDRLFRVPSWELNFAKPSTIADVVSLLDDGSYKLEIEVPGFSKENISLLTKDGQLYVTLNHANKPEKKFSYKLNNKIDPDSIKATCKDGILTVVCPLRESVTKSVTIVID